MIHNKTWALVTNGVHARILRGLEKGDHEEPIEIINKSDTTHLGEMMSDKLGRSVSSGTGGRRSAMEPGSDPVHRNMQDFAQETLSVLETHLRAEHFNRLAVFAAPRMLGIIRHEMPSLLQKAVMLESDANLINLPDADVQDFVRNAIGEGARK